MILCIGSVPTDLCDMVYLHEQNIFVKRYKKKRFTNKKKIKNNNSIVNVYDVVMIMSHSSINKETF